MCKLKLNGLKEESHFGELVGGSASDLGDAKESKFCFEILQLVQKLLLRFVPQLVNLNPRFLQIKSIEI